MIDYGMGNLHSVASALEHVGATDVVVSHDSAEIAAADRVVFREWVESGIAWRRYAGSAAMICLML